MINVPTNLSSAFNRQTILSYKKIQKPLSSHTINILHATGNNTNPHKLSGSFCEAAISPGSTFENKSLPSFKHLVQKGQKTLIQTSSSKIHVHIGWNIKNPNCDVDVSAFLLNQTGKVIGDDWFVFYGQELSPDGSIRFSSAQTQDRETISVDFNKLNPHVTKIVFVLTINDALTKNLNFSMIKDAYIRILDDSNRELVSFLMDDYYSTVTSMMIGELYLHNDTWKFNAIGNGVARDLAGLCEFYGVQII